MENKMPVKRPIICAAIAIVAGGIGIYIVRFSSGYNMINEVFQSLLAAAVMTAISEIFAVLSRFPIISYIISAILCMVSLQAITPWNMIMPFVVSYQDDKIFIGHQLAVRSCLVMYSIALVVSILFGIFVLHRKDIFKSNK